MAELTQDQRDFMAALETKMNDIIDGRISGAISKDDATQMISKAVAEAQAKASEEDKAEITELRKSVSDLSDKIFKIQNKGLDTTKMSKFDEKLNEMFESPKFKDFVSGKTRNSGEFGGFSMKDIVSLTDNYEGTILLTQQLDKVVSKYQPKKLHLRDILPTLQGEPEYPYLAYAEISKLDRNARYVSENGRLPESSFSLKENQVGTKRLGTYIHLSKRMLKSRVYVRSYVLSMLPEAVLMAEDWGILFGDGAGENLLGIANKEGTLPVEDVVTEAVVSGEAGSVASIKAANDGKDAIIEFTDAQADILDGMRITLTGSANAKLNEANDVVKMNDRQVLIVGVGKDTAITDEDDTSSVTFTANNGAFKSVSDPNSLDAIRTAFAVMTYANYTPTAIVLNPITVNAIESEKDTTGRNLGLVVLENGVKTIAGRPIIEFSGIPAGKYLLGDFSINGASIVDYTTLTLEWADDVEDKLTNSVHLIAQEEIIFPVYNPWAFAYGDLAKLKSAITAE